MDRLNGGPEACQVTETLRVTCYGNFERGTAGVFFKPLTIGASSVAALTIDPLPSGYAHCRRPRPAMRRAGEEGRWPAAMAWLGPGDWSHRTSRGLPQNGYVTRCGRPPPRCRVTMIFAQSKGAHGPRSNRHRL